MKTFKYGLLYIILICLTGSAYAEQSEEWMIGAKVGVSPFTGLVGAEIQKNNFALAFGTLGLISSAGLRYYLSGLDHSWYAGPFVWNGSGPDNDDVSKLIGAGMGYRWQYRSGVNIVMGISVYREKQNNNEKKFGVFPELSIGIAF